VLGRAVPAGVVIAVLTMTVFALAQLDSSIDQDHARSVAVLVAGTVALMNLYRVARPMNPLRATLVVTMVVLFGLAFVIPAGRDLFELPVTAGWAYGMAGAAIAVAYPLLMLGSWASERVGARLRTRAAARTSRAASPAGA
jgi:cation-transporting ATPase E